MFAILILEHEPFDLKQAREGLHTWLWVMGTVCALGILCWTIWAMTMRRRSEEAPWTVRNWLFLVLSIVAGLAYLGYLGVRAPVILQGLSTTLAGPTTEKPARPLFDDSVTVLGQPITLLDVASGCALAAALVFPLLDLFTLRWRLRRIWAIALLSLKEAVRRKILWAFLVVLVFFLFVMWFLPSKPEDQIKTYVQAVFFVVGLLLFVIAGLTASLSIPADIKNQTIHTILTKPVERFELVMGRFLGFAILITGVLFGLTLFSLLYLLQEIHPEAVSKSLKARVPVYGDLYFYSGDTRKDKGIQAKEWNYRSYISSERSGMGQQAAAFAFHDVPKDLTDKETVPCEYSFDIYRTTKGVGVAVSFYCRAWHFEEQAAVLQQERIQRYRSELEQERKGAPVDFLDFLDSWLILKYGYYAVPGQEITDYRTFTISLPVALFQDPGQRLVELRKQAASCPAEYKRQADDFFDSNGDPNHKQELRPEQRAKLRELEATLSLEDRQSAFLYRELPTLGMHVDELTRNAKVYQEKPRLEVRATCDTPNQYIGMARYDFYILDAEQPAAFNFLRGAVGLWFALMVVIAINVALSTFLSGVITWLCSLVWFVLAMVREHIVSLAQGTSYGGGPMESLYRLVRRESISTIPDQTAVFSAAARSDEITRSLFKVLLFFVPNPEHYWYIDYVAEGFSVPTTLLAVSGLEMLKWIVSFGLAGYYFMKWREVASAS